MTVFYLAAPYRLGHELHETVVKPLRAAGHTIQAHWISAGEPEVSAEQLNLDPAFAASFARTDLHDIRACDAVVSFTEQGTGRGGRHVEYGYAMAAAKRLILVGPREHIFHALADETYPDVRSFLNRYCIGDVSAAHRQAQYEEGFYEPDEDPADVARTFDAGEKGATGWRGK